MSTVTVPKYSSGAHDTSSRSTGLSSTKCWKTTRGIAQPHRRYRGLRTLCGDHDTGAIIELDHLEPVFFAPLCEDPDDYGRRVYSMVTKSLLACFSIPVGQSDPNDIANPEPPTPAKREIPLHGWRLVIVPCGLVLSFRQCFNSARTTRP